MGKDSNSAKAARAAAAAARSEAQAQERARDRKVRTIGAIVVLLIMGGLLYPAIRQSTAPATNANAALPKGVTSDTFGVKVGPAWTAANADTIPVLQLWEDFQCPACKAFEDASGAKLDELVKAGKVRLEYRPTLFLDANLADKNTAAGNPESSLHATMAFGCAVDQGLAMEYHKAIFAAQPEEEGQGFSNADLTEIAQNAGFSAQQVTDFMECLTNQVYKDWANNSYDAFSKAGVTSTPTGFLNGTEVKSDVLFDPAALESAITAATTS
jgi:protein-disulfide isomerase